MLLEDENWLFIRLQILLTWHSTWSSCLWLSFRSLTCHGPFALACSTFVKNRSSNAFLIAGVHHVSFYHSIGTPLTVLHLTPLSPCCVQQATVLHLTPLSPCYVQQATVLHLTPLSPCCVQQATVLHLTPLSPCYVQQATVLHLTPLSPCYVQKVTKAGGRMSLEKCTCSHIREPSFIVMSSEPARYPRLHLHPGLIRNQQNRLVSKVIKSR